MSDKNFHGDFVFRNQGHGILSSTYFNTPTPTPYPETAILLQKKFHVTVYLKTNKKGGTVVRSFYMVYVPKN